MKYVRTIGAALPMLGFALVFSQPDVADAARICPSSGPDDTFTATLNQQGGCYTGEFETGTTWAGAKLTAVNPPGGSQGRKVEAYLFSTGALCAKARGFKTIAGVTSPSCTVNDTTANGQWQGPSNVSACDYTNVVWITAYNSSSCT